MSDSLSTGYTSDSKPPEECKESPTYEHVWDEHGTYPSKWWKCQHCKKSKYSK